jgi:TRAP-type uncharacterized transport system substrate-binding protein
LAGTSAPRRPAARSSSSAAPSAEVLAGATGDRGWQVTAEATSGSQENIRRLAQGELDLALSNAAITYFAVRGTRGGTASIRCAR